ncbi:putative cyclin-dependent protein kinase [Tripterygium wilfordii]|uniref:Putative cyclin-dependent protein kinase n=1 Tax=Tripterygium wilfordii TaxID=458696 RepID=A0A7J7CF47_TRIWF|nr:cyclin-U3-1-like [Tripterygium wilfordii]XP_038682762.1 cyclin-U3-1-like [Tripterygium wilfordii]KAF5732768.1 putative cyclin-dependent protein kinase [Tripterygium wilfordii]
MGTKEIAIESLDADIYVTLGLEGSSNAVPGSLRILSLLSSLLERTVHKNEMLLETTSVKDVVTIFHGLRAPNISIRQYVDRIFKYSGCSPSCFVVAHIYVDRFLQQTDVRLTSLNVHRLLITSLMVAAKFIDDAFFNNAYYAKVGGVSTRELNRLEVKLLFTLDFRLLVSVDTFRTYCYQMEKEGAEWHQIERPMQACRIKDNWSKKDDSTTCASTVAR